MMVLTIQDMSVDELKARRDRVKARLAHLRMLRGCGYVGEIGRAHV